MFKNFTRLCAATVMLLFSTGAFAQVNTNGGSGLSATYPSLAAAVTALNAATITSPVIITMTANEAAPAGGYIISASGTSGNTIILNGAGFSVTGSAAQVAGSVRDAIFKINGGDYITINNFVMTDNVANTNVTLASNTMTEFGIVIGRANTTNGAQNNTISNNTITLRNGTTYGNTVGIYMTGRHDVTATDYTIAGTATAAGGANSNNTIKNNTISGVTQGVQILGDNTTNDMSTSVGSTPGTGNTITIGPNTAVMPTTYSGSPTTMMGIAVAGNSDFTAGYNTINTSGTTSSIAQDGIFFTATQAVAGSAAVLSNNTISLNQTAAAATTSAVYGIRNAASQGTGTLTINTNTINLTSGTNGNGLLGWVYNTGSYGTININGNNFSSNGIAGTGSAYLLYNSQSSAGNSNIVGNQTVGNITRTGTSGAFYGYYNGSSPSSGTETINGNNFSNINIGTTSSTFYGIYIISSTSQAKSISGNTVSNITCGTGILYGLYPGYLNTPSIVQNNTITNLTGAGTVYGMYTSSSIGGSISGNTINSLLSTAASGTVIGFYGSTSTNAFLFTGNTISNLTASGATSPTIRGIQAVAGNIFNITQNTISGLNATASAATGASVFGITVAGPTLTSVTRNKIYNLSAAGAGGVTKGINVTSGATTDIQNNLIGDLSTPGSTSNSAISGIEIAGGTTVNVVHNTVHLAATSTGTTFGTSAFYVSTATPVVTSANNIFINNSIPGATGGFTAAFRYGVAVTANYSSNSNNNLYYAGTPAANSLIYGEGTTAAATNGQQTLGGFQTYMATRDAASVTENVAFTSLSGASAGYLHVDPSTPTLTESAGTTTTGVGLDYDADIRATYTGYAGTGTAPDIGADEFAGTNPNSCSGTPFTASISTAVSSVCANASFTINITNSTFQAGISYQLQSRLTGGGTFANLGNAQNSATFTVSNQTAGTDYQVIVTCANGGGTSTSNTISIAQSSLQSCYCTPGSTPTSEYIKTVTVSNYSNSSTFVASGYSDYTSSQTAPYPTLFAGSPNPINVLAHINSTPAVAGVWVDYNQNGTFETTEYTQIGTSGGTNTDVTFYSSIDVPNTATPGVTRMRVRSNNSAGLTSAQACATGLFGESEDYLVQVVATPSCLAPTALTASGISGTGATISWTASTSAPSSYDVYYGTTPLALPTATTTPTLTGITGTSTTLALAASTTYLYYVRSNCGGGNYSTWAGPFTITTPCAASPLPYNEGFESLTVAGTLPNCMSASPTVSTTGKTRTYIASASTTNSALVARTGSKFAAVYYLPNAAGYFFSAPLQLTAGMSYTASVWYKTDGVAWPSAGLKFGNAATIAGMTNSIATITNAAATAYTQITGTFTVSSSGIYYVSFFADNTANNAPNYMAFDDLSVTVTPSCVAPTILTASNVTATGADIGFTGTAGSYIIEYGAPNFTPGTGATAGTGGTVVTTTTNPQTISGLTASTTYDVYVRQNCTGAGNGYSANSAKITFTTACNPLTTFPYSEGFESLTVANTLPACMSASPIVAPGGKNQTYIASASGTNSALVARTGSKFAAVYYLPNAAGYFFSAPLQLTAGTTYTTSVWYKTDGVAWPSAGLKFGSTATIAGMTNSITTVTNAAATAYTQISGTFTPATSGVYYVSFFADNTANNAPNYMAFDDFSVDVAVACAAPTTQATALNLTAPATTSVSGTFTASSPAATGYLVLQTPGTAAPSTAPVNGTSYASGATLGNATVIASGSSTSFTSSSLTSGNQYTYTVYGFNSGTCVGGPVYNTSLPLSGSISTPTVAIYTGTGNWSNAANWSTGTVPNSCAIQVQVAANSAVTVDGTYQASSLTTNTTTSSIVIPATSALNVCTNATNNGSVTLSGGVLTVAGNFTNVSGATYTETSGAITLGATGGDNKVMSNAGTYTMSGGTAVINGQLISTAGAFTQSAGAITVDGNSGTAATSLASGVVTFQISGGTNSLTGGSVTIVDPPHSSYAASSTRSVNISSNSTSTVFGGTHTIILGDGVSTTPGNADGFVVETYSSSVTPIMNLTVNSGSIAGRQGSGSYNNSTAYGTHIKGNLTINSGSEFRTATVAASTTQMFIGGNIINNGTFTALATTTSLGEMTGATNPAAQTISGTGIFRNNTTGSTADVRALTVKNGNGVTINRDLSFSGALTLTAGTGVVAPSRITLPAAYKLIQIAGASASYSATAGWVNGRYQTNATAGGISNNFPIGDATTYAPVNITGTGASSATAVLTAGNIVASTRPGEHPSINGAKINQDKDVNRYWTIEENSGITFSANSVLVKLNWASTDVDAAATPANFIVGRYLNPAWIYPTVSLPAATSIQALNDQNGSAFTIMGDYITGQEAAKPAITAGLQGAMQTGGTMTNNLQNFNGTMLPGDLLPSTDPYGLGATYTAINNTTGIVGAVTDWVRVDVYDPAAAAPAAPVESRALLLKPNGQIVDTRNLTPAFAVRSGNMRLVVKHRNHLAVMSNNVVMNGVFAYDFTTSLSQASVQAGDPVQMVLVGGKWCLWSGDVISDYFIEGLDFSTVSADNDANLPEGYRASDLNLDGFTDGLDVSVISVNNDFNLYSTLVNY